MLMGEPGWCGRDWGRAPGKRSVSIDRARAEDKGSGGWPPSFPPSPGDKKPFPSMGYFAMVTHFPVRAGGIAAAAVRADREPERPANGRQAPN